MREDGLAAARALLPGWRLDAACALAGGERSSVHRVRARHDDGREASFIVKQFVSAGAGPAREAAALTTMAGEPGVPQLVAAGHEPPVLVLADLGDGPDVAAALLGDDPEAARHAVIRWAEAIATVHAASRGRRDTFGAELAARSGAAALDPSWIPVGIGEAVRVLDSACGSLGVTVPGSALDDLRELAHRLGDGGPAALTPADACPDNNVYVGDRVVLLDFEDAQWRHVAWDVSYLRVPWPTCWCAWALPDRIADEAIEAYRAVAGATFPEVESPDFAADVDAAALAWAFMSTSWFLDAALAGDTSPSLGEENAPTRRATILHRLDRAAACTQLPAVAELARNLTGELRGRWGDVPLALAPAFRR